MFWCVAISFANPPKYVHGTFAKVECDMSRKADENRVSDRQEEIIVSDSHQLVLENVDAMVETAIQVLLKQHHVNIAILLSRQYVFLMRVLNYVYARHII